MITRRGSARTHHAARVAWLRAHPEMLLGVPGIGDDVTEERRPPLLALVAALKAAGLIGTMQPDMQRETVRRLVSEIRGSRVEGRHW